jgi:hypothetical protein
MFEIKFEKKKKLIKIKYIIRVTNANKLTIILQIIETNKKLHNDFHLTTNCKKKNTTLHLRLHV